MAKKTPTKKRADKKPDKLLVKLQEVEEARAISTRPTTSALATFGNMETIAGFGLEDTTADDYAIPFLRILQPLSPQVVDKTVEGAEAGDIIETATDELYTEVDLIPCVYQRRFVQWKPRERGGGFVAIHEADSAVVQSAVRQGNKDMLKNGM